MSFMLESKIPTLICYGYLNSDVDFGQKDGILSPSFSLSLSKSKLCCVAYSRRKLVTVLLNSSVNT